MPTPTGRGGGRGRAASLVGSAALVVTLGTLGAGSCGETVDPVSQVRVTTPGYAEPRTPGAGTSDELPLTPTARALLGSEPDLNRVTTVRTRWTGEGGERPPGAVLILIPGFLGGASTFDPIARDLVRHYRGSLEVWAVDRRTNQLEDRRGALRARRGLERALDRGDLAGMRSALEEGVRFYFAPLDLDGDGTPEPPFEMEDRGGNLSAFLRLEQDDARFLAHWGVDTYVRDWRGLVDEARDLVGEDGLVVLGGHSQGTSWAGIYAAYDFDTGPGVDAGWAGLDGLVLFEGGGPRAPAVDAPDRDGYRAAVAALARAGGPDVYLSDLFGFGIDPVELGAAGELNGLAGTFLPGDPAILQKTRLFGGFPLFILFGAPMTNRSLVGFFLDDDFSANPAFSASFGFSDDGPNIVTDLGDFLVATPGTTLRTWKEFDDPSLPTCPPNDPKPLQGSGGVGCAIQDLGPRPAPGDPPRRWGVEREVTDASVLLRSLYETGNASEWYFATRPLVLDFQYGRDSSGLGDPTLLNVTQNASMALPVLAIGGSNGLAPSESSFAGYLGSIATPPERTRVVILEGYSHLDVLTAADNGALPAVEAFLADLWSLREEASLE